jgi:hypothetical protein
MRDFILVIASLVIGFAGGWLVRRKDGAKVDAVAQQAAAAVDAVKTDVQNLTK